MEQDAAHVQASEEVEVTHSPLSGSEMCRDGLWNLHWQLEQIHTYIRQAYS